MGAPSIPSNNAPATTVATVEEEPGLVMKVDDPAKPPHTEKTEAQRRAERGTEGTRQSLVINQLGGVGMNVPNQGVGKG